MGIHGIHPSYRTIFFCLFVCFTCSPASWDDKSMFWLHAKGTCSVQAILGSQNKGSKHWVCKHKKESVTQGGCMILKSLSYLVKQKQNAIKVHQSFALSLHGATKFTIPAYHQTQICMRRKTNFRCRRLGALNMSRSPLTSPEKGVAFSRDT